MKKDKRQSLRQTDEFIKTYKSVLRIFDQVQQSTTINKAHIMELVLIHRDNALFFDKAFQQVFLKIFKCFHQKANKKIPTKFQTVADLLFKQIMKDPTEQSQITYNYFCSLLCQAAYSKIMNVRVMAARILFLMLKGIPLLSQLRNILDDKNQNQFGKAVLFLVKLKVSTYRQLGIKLSSLALSFNTDSKLAIQNQLLKILSTQQNQMIRKMVMTNLPINYQNIDKIIIRLRDKNPQIRATLLRKLLTDRCLLERLKLNTIYKLLYDGYGTKDIICKQQALRYFASYFKEDSNKMQEQNKFQRFIQIFQPNVLLVNSHLYLLFNKLIGQLLSFLPLKIVTEYILKLCNKTKACVKDKSISLSYQLIWLKNASINRPQIKQINNIFEEYSPSGTQFAQLLLTFLERRNLFAMNQILRMFTHINMPDEMGRNRMFDTLKLVLNKLTLFQPNLNLSQISKNDQICNIQTVQQIRLKKFLLSYYDIPIMSNSLDLIYPIIQAMKSLRPKQFSRQIQQQMSQWEDPQSNLNIEKSTSQLTLQKLQSNPQELKLQKSKNLYETLKQKLKKINQQIQFINMKMVEVITSLSKVQYDWKIDHYMALIKRQITKSDQSHGLYLLGFYCLSSIQKLRSFLPIYWRHIMSQPPQNKSSPQYQQYKLNLMISLKLMTDFVVKFNILNCQQIMNDTSTDQTTIINADTFMEQITHLILNQDSDIRVFSIQCLCRMIYHNRVDQNNISTYFLYLLLLWWETSNEEVSAKSVHTISLFFRSYIEKGNMQVKKLAQMLCIFHKILKIFEQKNKTINKKLIVYNLKMNQFIKKTVSIATTVLKYHKQKKTIWTYEQPELGPQQFFLLYLLYQPGFQNMLQKSINVCDFYQKCPLQTLLFVKKKLEKFLQMIEDNQFFPESYRNQKDKLVTKKSLQQISRFEKQIQTQIQVKGQQVFNQQITNTLQKIFVQSCKYINEQARRIAKNIQQEEIFINIDSEDESSQNDVDQSSQEDQELDVDQSVHSISSVASGSKSIKNRKIEGQNNMMISNKANNKKKTINQNIKNNLEQISDQREDDSASQQSDSVQQIKPSVNKRGNRKRPPLQSTNKRNSNLKEQTKVISNGKNQNPEQPKRFTRARKIML